MEMACFRLPKCDGRLVRAFSKGFHTYVVKGLASSSQLAGKVVGEAKSNRM